MLEAPAPREARKTVTVLFADLSGSTALGEQLDPESLRRVMALYFETAQACLGRHGATVEKFIGDAVMAVFGVPVVHEDDALRALRAAAELRGSLSALNQDLETEYGVSLHARIGVNTGVVVVGTQERLATGDAVNVAARLEQAAAADEILLGEETYRLARDAIEVEPVAPLALRGKSTPIAAHRLRRVLEGASAFERRLDAPLVGRREELNRARSAFDRAVAERRCQLVTVLGPPGIGKSRLAREVATELRDDAEVLAGRCLPYGDGITFWPLREVFAAAGAAAELDAALAAGSADELFWAVRRFIEGRARQRPLALVIEDIHWAEPTLLDLLEHLADWTRDAPLLVLCLARPELLDGRPTWTRERPNAETLKLEPLGDDQSGELIEGLLGETSFDEGVRARIRQVAEGNPLFVEQLVATLVEGGDVDRVPSTIQALLAARLDTLSEPERDVLERASVIGVEFDWAALGRLDADGRRPSGALLSGLVRKELIRPHRAIEDTFHFRHLLIRDAAYEPIPKMRRAELHERAADWLAGGGDDFDEIVGHHFEQAFRCLAELGRPDDRGRALAGKAAEHLAASGRRANARGDSQGATNLLERAAALLPADDPRRLALLPVLGRVLREAGQMERADSVLAEAVERATAAGERGVAADAGVALADLRFHRPAYTGVGRDDVLREVDAATRIFDERGDQAGLGRALCLGGKLRFWGGEAAIATEDFERAARNSRDAGDRAEESESLRYVLATMHRGPMPVDNALVRIEELRPRAALNRRLRIAFLETSAQLEAMRGRFDAARDLVAQATASAQEHGLQVLLDSHTRPSAGSVELLAGDAVAAERELRLACEGMERAGELGFLSSVAP
ncbi:MAG: ATP-binding protein, partial [Solirubrobacterales bacterium]